MTLPATGRGLRRLLATEDGGPIPPPADVAGRAEAALHRLPPDEAGDPADFQRALDLFLHATERAVVNAGTDGPLRTGDRRAIEAVIRVDGTRPTLLVHDDAVDPHHPLAGDWSDAIAASQDALRPVLRAVGRIEPDGATARSFFGTGWVVDAQAGLVLTNLHVLEAMWGALPQYFAPSGRGFRVYGGAYIDFAREAGSTRTNRFRIVEAFPSGVDGPGYDRFDAAVLRIEPTPGGGDPPPAIRVSPDLDGPAGNLLSFCVVGYPGPPRYLGGVHEGVDWTWVNTTLFGNRYGVKRLAPGVAHRPLGSLPGDAHPWVFGHDPTTLGGNSGSPVLSWLDPEPAGFGLHFAGATVDTNLAHALGACVPELHTLGVPV